jgi:hypothetical protein
MYFLKKNIDFAAEKNLACLKKLFFGQHRGNQIVSAFLKNSLLNLNYRIRFTQV